MSKLPPLEGGPVSYGNLKTPGVAGTLPVTHPIVVLENWAKAVGPSTFVIPIVTSAGTIELSEPIPSPTLLPSPVAYVASVVLTLIATHSPGAAGNTGGGSTD